jgi:hypothetical protein
LVGVGVMLFGASSLAAVSALLAYWISPVVVASLPLVVVAFWVIQRYTVGALGAPDVRRSGVARDGVGGRGIGGLALAGAERFGED